MSSDGAKAAPTPQSRTKGSHKRTSSTSTGITTNATSTHHRKPSYTQKNSSSYLNIPQNFKSLGSIQQSPNEVIDFQPHLLVDSDDSPPQSSTPSKRDRYKSFFSSYKRPSLLMAERNGYAKTHHQLPTSNAMLPLRWPSFLRYRWLRFLLFMYAIFSVCVTFVHLFQWTFDQNWTELSGYSSDFSDFGQDRSNVSHITQMSRNIKFSKMFSDQMPQNLDNITPFFLRAKRSPAELDVSLLTVVTEDSVNDLVDLAEMWQGPVCAVLHIEATSALPPDTTSFLFRVRHMHESNPSMRAHVDIHLIITPPRESEKLSLSLNQDRNMARLFARSEFVIHVDPSILHISDITFTLAAKREHYHELLLSGDVLVIPSFVHMSSAEEGIPQDKHTVVAMLDALEVAMYDANHNINSGPTNLEQWKNSKTLYAAKYEDSYAPVAIMSRSQTPWCPERFTDNLASCFLGTHLAGGTFWVLADDYVIQAPNAKANTLNKAEVKMQQVLYNRYVPEMCVHYARKLASLGLWSSSAAGNIKSWAGCHSTRSTWRQLTATSDK
ncbi:hypothetical protein K450DRAFT_23784 [Umbelopsis ramanniana AG]|uniref:Uncharacterized protein n=1 Tax=Umbelopsis ramanniana AG TaxID=1314678 RepID=A0AAD5EFH7_UMBRA|nr:uncharacterized protein K450DRAFT_23784 [Umbelopsis ramanniana AG]KAI8581335.1 hypothetical protein K450DRAFT_23784 [Umbelopsis ramanniana AG]